MKGGDISMNKKNNHKVPEVLSANTLMGTNVENMDGEDIGSIKEIMIDLDQGQVSYAVLQFGGIMGLGDKLYAIPWQALKFDAEEDKIILDIDKKLLKEDDGFDKDDWPDFANYKWVQKNYEVFGFTPYWT